MFKILLSLSCIALISCAPASEALMVNQILSTKQCIKSSPLQNMLYGNQEIKSLPTVLFCEKHAGRTCCDRRNFELLELKWVRTFHIGEISSKCYEALQQLICYECDGDVGQGIRQGICPHTCEQIFEACRFDYFTSDIQAVGRVVPCNRNSLICSPLQDIVDKPKEFCNYVGYPINEKVQFDDTFLLDIAQNKTIEPVCYDGTPSALLWGKSLNIDIAGARKRTWGGILATKFVILFIVSLLFM